MMMEAAEEAALWSASVVEQCPAFSEIAGEARRVGQVPGVDDLALKIDEVHVSVCTKRGANRV
jgi:hypothetical protein